MITVCDGSPIPRIAARNSPDTEEVDESVTSYFDRQRVVVYVVSSPLAHSTPLCLHAQSINLSFSRSSLSYTRILLPYPLFTDLFTTSLDHSSDPYCLRHLLVRYQNAFGRPRALKVLRLPAARSQSMI